MKRCILCGYVCEPFNFDRICDGCKENDEVKFRHKMRSVRDEAKRAHKGKREHMETRACS